MVSIPTLKQFRVEEPERFLLLKEIVEPLSADPTAQTSDPDVSAFASIGIPKVIFEPQATVLQCLEAVHTASLTNNAAWQLHIAAQKAVKSKVSHSLVHREQAGFASPIPPLHIYRGLGLLGFDPQPNLPSQP